MPRPLPQIPPRYRGLRRLGGGGTASVLLVEDRACEPRLKALKLLRRRATASATRLGHEFESLARLRHPSLPRVYDFGVVRGRAWYTTEYVEGTDLFSASAGWSPRDLSASLAAVSRVLAFVHAQGLLHNDVKPSNIVVGGAPDRVWLLDFGLAAPAHERLPERSGTLPYMALERLEGEAPDARSDLYSLGASYYRAVARRFPIEAATLPDALSALRRGVRPLRGVRPDCPPTLETVLMRLLAPRRQDRPACALEVIADLDRAGLGPFELETTDTLEAYVLSAKPAGRAEAVARLREAASVAASGRPMVVWLLGEPGAGKSRLLTDIGQEWELRGGGAAACVAGCAPPPGAPFGAALELCRRALALHSTGVPQGVASVLRRWMPDLDLAVEPAPEVSADAERARLGDAIARALMLPAEEAPLLLALDNAGWADDASLHSLQILAASLARQADHRPLLLILTADGEQDLRRAGPALAPSAAHVVRIDLPPLGSAAVSEVLRSVFGRSLAVSDRLLDGLHARCGGNPLLLVEILRALARQGAVRRRMDGFDLLPEPLSDLPPRLDDFLRARLAALRGAERDLVMLLATAGRPLRVPEGPARAALRSRGLLQEEAGGIRLCHQSLCEAALADLPDADRAALHRRVAVLLAAQSAPADELAHHYDRAGMAGEAFGHSLRAGARARALGEAARARELLDRAAELAPAAAAPPAMIGELEEERGLVALARGEADGAERHLRAALEPAEARQRQRRLTLCARAALARGDLAGTEALIAEAERLVPEPHPAGLAALAWARARLLGLRGRHSEVHRVATEALARLERAGAGASLRRDLEEILGDAAVHLGDLREAEAIAERALVLARELGDPLGEALAERDLGIYGRYRGHPQAALDRLGRALDYFRRTGHSAATSNVLEAMALSALDLGDPGRALTLADQALDLGVEGSEWRPRGSRPENVVRGTVLLRAGRLAEARVVLREVLARGDELLPERAAAAALALAELCSQIGDAAGAEAAAMQVGELAERVPTPVLEAFSARARAYACWAAGDLTAAEAKLRDTRERYARLGHRPPATVVLRQLGEVLLGQGSDDEAREILRRAATEYAEMGNRSESRRCRSLAGEPTRAWTPEPGDLGDLRAALRAIASGASPAVAALQLGRDLRRAAIYVGPEWGRPATAAGEWDGEPGRAPGELVSRAVKAGEPLQDSGGHLAAAPGLASGEATVCLLAQGGGPIAPDDVALLSLLADAGAAYVAARGEPGKPAPDAPGRPAGRAVREPGRGDARALEITLGGIELRHGFPEIVGRSAPMRGMLGVLDRVVETDMPVLLVGETGTGKEIVARAVHENSRRAQGPFQALNCAAVAPSLAESELFGHRRGAFTGAIADRTGVVRAAHAGTLFLDEIGEMDVALQAKLLRTLEEGSVRPVGDTKEHSVDFRLIAATHCDLPELIAAGRFRQDLYYRLSVMEIRLPPLRERPGDIPELVEHLLGRLAAEIGPGDGEQAMVRVDPAAMELLSRHAWPGNVRELENELRRALVLAGGSSVGPQHLSRRLREAVASSRGGPVPAAATSLHQSVRELEIREIREALHRAGGNKARAARTLGLSWQGLAKKIARYGLRS